jgi:glycine betaine catabolism B
MVYARQLLEARGFDPARLHAESFAPPRSVSEQGVESSGASRIPSVYPGSPDVVSVEFAKSGKKISGSRKLSLLDLAEANGIELDYGCRTGGCGACKVRLLRGDTRGGASPALSRDEQQQGYVLSCVAAPTSDCVLDA